LAKALKDAASRQHHGDVHHVNHAVHDQVPDA
jgi:hypothetical protein